MQRGLVARMVETCVVEFSIEWVPAKKVVWYQQLSFYEAHKLAPCPRRAVDPYCEGVPRGCSGCLARHDHWRAKMSPSPFANPVLTKHLLTYLCLPRQFMAWAHAADFRVLAEVPFLPNVAEWDQTEDHKRKTGSWALVRSKVGETFGTLGSLGGGLGLFSGCCGGHTRYQMMFC